MLILLPSKFVSVLHPQTCYTQKAAQKWRENMEAIEKTSLLKDDMIMELLDLLKQNTMREEANHTFVLCAYIDSLESKLDCMTDELAKVKQQLKDMKEDTVVNNLKTQVWAAADRLQERCNIIKEQLLAVKDIITSKASELVVEAKRKGKEVLNKVSELLGVKEKLVSIREQVKEAHKDVSTTIAKIDAFGAGMREVNQKIANTFRTFADKEEVDYSQKERVIIKTEIVKKPWVVKKKILEAMELRLDAVIDKAENLARDADIDRMMKKFDQVMEKGNEQIGGMVAEAMMQYGADAFEESEKGRMKCVTGLDEGCFEVRKEGKGR